MGFCKIRSSIKVHYFLTDKLYLVINKTYCKIFIAFYSEILYNEIKAHIKIELNSSYN